MAHTSGSDEVKFVKDVETKLAKHLPQEEIKWLRAEDTIRNLQGKVNVDEAVELILERHNSKK